MMIGDNPEELVEKINEHLPPQIRVYGIQRTNNAFNSHIHCDSRVHEYIIPSHCFIPPKPGSTASTYVRSSESQGREPEPEDTFWDNIVAPDFYSLLQRQISQRRESEDRLPDLSPEESERLQKMKSDETEAIRSFRISPSRLSRIRSAFNVYIGTHNFHNLTIGVPVHSAHASRYIMSIDIAEPKIFGSTEWLRIKIHGQSFMLHQIRKMVGAVLISIRYGVGEESIRHILTTRTDMHIPKAPAQGLLLERPVFAGISEKIKKFGNEALEWNPYEEKIEKFKEEFIYSSIFRETTAENMYFLTREMANLDFMSLSISWIRSRMIRRRDWP
jgi:tRNA pseudouridine38-40 synthase